MAANHDQNCIEGTTELPQVNPATQPIDVDPTTIEAYRHAPYQPFADRDELLQEDEQSNRRFSSASAYFSYRIDGR